jgi:predicted amidohydrolase YtcJ
LTLSTDGPADLVILGRVATLAGDEGFGWQGGVAIREGRVLVVGGESELEGLIGRGTRTWRLPDELLAMPGITDAHLHLMSMVIAERQIDLTGSTLDQALDAIRARHEEMSRVGDGAGWLLGHGWSLDKLGRWPDADDLERAAPGRSIALWAHDHHARWISHRALVAAGIGDESVGPGRGQIRRDETGAPTGVLHESAAVLVDKAIPVPTKEELTAALGRLAQQLASLGLTGCHDPGELTADPSIDRGPLFYSSLASDSKLPLRVHSSVRAVQLETAIRHGLRSGDGVAPSVGGDRVAADRAARYHMGWLKIFADGSMGSRSAALLEPYDDAAANPPLGGPLGMIVTDSEELTELLTRAAEEGITGKVHALGDWAVRTVLDVFAAMPRNDSPLMRRIEHAQLVDPADTARFGALGVAASVQPVHLRSDAALQRIAWGERAENTFPLAALHAGGALIPIGTDAPIEPPDPWPGIAVAVARRDPFEPGAQLTGVHNAIGLARAVRGACLDPALVAGEAELGRLMPGCRADVLVVQSRPFREPFDAAAFASIRPVATLIDGEFVYGDDSP